MQFIIDVHLHSRFARATSRDLNPSNLHKWSALKGVDVVGTGDYTHPEWFAELSEQLEPAEEGLYQLKAAWREAVEQELPEHCRRAVRFMLSVEISTIYKKGDKTRKIHHVVILPTLESVAPTQPPPRRHWQLAVRRPAHLGAGQPRPFRNLSRSRRECALRPGPYMDAALCRFGRFFGL